MVEHAHEGRRPAVRVLRARRSYGQLLCTGRGATTAAAASSPSPERWL
jgi:hypothetical protein